MPAFLHFSPFGISHYVKGAREGRSTPRGSERDDNEIHSNATAAKACIDNTETQDERCTMHDTQDDSNSSDMTFIRASKPTA